MSAELDPAAYEDVLDTPQAGGLIIRGGVVRLGSYVAVVALSVVSAAVLTRYLGVARFGQYTTVISLVTVVSLVTDAGMSSLGTREYAVREGHDRDQHMRDLLGLRVTLTLLGSAFAVLFAALAGYDTALLAGTVVASLGTVALVLQHTLTIPLAARLRLGAMAGLDFARQALTVVAIVVLVLLGAGVFPLLAVMLAVYLLLIPVSATLIRGELSIRIELSPRRWAALLSLTISFSLATAVGAIYVYTAQILTSVAASAHQSGLFAAGFRVFIVAATVPGLLVSGALPLLARTARDDRARLAYAMQRIFEASLILGLAAAIGLLAGAHFVIAVVAGPKFAGAEIVVQILGLALSASFVAAGWGFALLSLDRYRPLLFANGAALLVSCVLTLVLASSDGARGAAIAMLCGEVTLACGYLVAIVSGHPELRPRLRVVPRAVLAAAPAIALGLLLDLPSLVRTVIALAVYAALIVATRAMPRELVELLPWASRPGDGHAS